MFTFARMAVSQGLGGAAGPMMAGFIYDYTKSYKFAIIIAGVGYATAGMACGLAAYLHCKRKRSGIENE